MTHLLDSFWRSVVYGLHPRVIALSFLPLLLLVGMALGLGYFYWEPAVDGVRQMLESSDLLNSFWAWLQGAGVGQLKTVVAPLIVIAVVTPVLVVVSLLVVAVLMVPSLVAMVGERRFANLQRLRGGSTLGSLAWSLGSVLLALVALIASIPLWLVPPLILILPPLIWGWLTYRVMAYDALAVHASKAERQQLFKRHRLSLLAMGVMTGYLGAAPSLVWASGALFAAAFVILVPVAIWIYTLVFAFSSLWFAHYCLAALERLRAESVSEAATVVAEPVPVGWQDERNTLHSSSSGGLEPPSHSGSPATFRADHRRRRDHVGQAGRQAHAQGDRTVGRQGAAARVGRLCGRLARAHRGHAGAGLCLGRCGVLVWWHRRHPRRPHPPMRGPCPGRAPAAAPTCCRSDPRTHAGCGPRARRAL